MNQDNTDDDWLEALAGQPRPGAKDAITQEALAVRRALAAMRRDAAARAQEGHEANERLEIDKALFALKREGLLRDALPVLTDDERAVAFSRYRTSTADNDMEDKHPGGVGTRGTSRWYGNVWAIAASILVVTGIGFQIPYEDDESWDKRSALQRIAQGESGPLVRGSGTETVIVSKDPRQRYGELAAGLSHAGIKFEAKESRRGDVRLRIEASLPALDYLDEQRINTSQVAAGWIYLRISVAQ